MNTETKNNLTANDNIRATVRWFPPERTADGGWQRRGYPSDGFWQAWKARRAEVIGAGLSPRKDVMGFWFVYERLTPDRARELRDEWEATARQNQIAFVRLDRRDLVGMKRGELEPMADRAPFPKFQFTMPERGEPDCVQYWPVGDSTSLVTFEYMWYIRDDALYASLLEHEQELATAQVKVKRGNKSFGHQLWWTVLVYASGDEQTVSES